MMSSAQTIKKIRLELCLEQREFGNLLGITGQQICNYERGTRTPSLHVIKKIRMLAKENGMNFTTEDFLKD